MREDWLFLNNCIFGEEIQNFIIENTSNIEIISYIKRYKYVPFENFPQEMGIFNENIFPSSFESSQ